MEPFIRSSACLISLLTVKCLFTSLKYYLNDSCIPYFPSETHRSTNTHHSRTFWLSTIHTIHQLGPKLFFYLSFLCPSLYLNGCLPAFQPFWKNLIGDGLQEVKLFFKRGEKSFLLLLQKSYRLISSNANWSTDIFSSLSHLEKTYHSYFRVSFSSNILILRSL